MKDSRYQFWNGNFAHVNVVLGNGAFQTSPNTPDSSDSLAFKKGSQRFWIVGPQIDMTQEGVVAQPAGATDPAVSKVVDYDSLPVYMDEIAYGFWFRYLTHYPTRMWNGKNEGWYFVARVTSN